MMWTKSIPTEEGFYWARSPRFNMCAPVYVVPSNRLIISINGNADFGSAQTLQIEFWTEKLKVPPENNEGNVIPIR